MKKMANEIGKDTDEARKRPNYPKSNEQVPSVNSNMESFSLQAEANLRESETVTVYCSLHSVAS